MEGRSRLVAYWFTIYLLLAVGSPVLGRYQGPSNTVRSLSLSLLFSSLCSVSFLCYCTWVCSTLLQRGNGAWFRQFLVLSSQSRDPSSFPQSLIKGARERLTGSAQRTNTFLANRYGHVDEDYGWPRLDLMFISVDRRLVWQPVKTTRRGGYSYPKWDKALYRKKMGEGMLTGTGDRCPLQIFYVSRSCSVFQQMSLKTEKTYNCKAKILLAERGEYVQKTRNGWVRLSLKLLGRVCHLFVTSGICSLGVWLSCLLLPASNSSL